MEEELKQYLELKLVAIQHEIQTGEQIENSPRKVNFARFWEGKLVGLKVAESILLEILGKI